MVGSMVTVESRSKDPGHRGEIIMGYDLDEPSALQSLDIGSESEGFKIQKKPCNRERHRPQCSRYLEQAPGRIPLGS